MMQVPPHFMINRGFSRGSGGKTVVVLLREFFRYPLIVIVSAPRVSRQLRALGRRRAINRRRKQRARQHDKPRAAAPGQQERDARQRRRAVRARKKRKPIRPASAAPAVNAILFAIQPQAATPGQIGIQRARMEVAPRRISAVKVPCQAENFFLFSGFLQPKKMSKNAGSCLFLYHIL